MVHHLTLLVPRPGRDDGRARGEGRAFGDPAVGLAVCAAVREARESFLQDGGYVVESGRDLHLDQGQVVLPLSGRRQARQDRRLPVAPRPWNRGGAGVLSQGARDHPCWRNVKLRTSAYLNNIVEQDHRAIKRRCAAMAGFKSFENAAVTIAGIELAHRIRKRQFDLGHGRRRRGRSRKEE